MYPIAKKYAWVALATASLLCLSIVPALANIQLTDCSWETNGTNVMFSLKFHNPDPAPSAPANGEMWAQPFGFFVQNTQLIQSFDIPTLAPDSFFDIFFSVSLSDLPLSAPKITPVGGSGGSSSAKLQGCPPDYFWAGNVDIFWGGPGGNANANYHFGTLQICPGGSSSYIHVFGNCPDPSGTSWSFGALCPGWSATLVTSNAMGLPGGPAPNPLPPGPFDGWICVSANAGVVVGSTCCFDLTLYCGPQPAIVHMCAEACIWETVPVESTTWGKVKSLYRE